MVVRSKALGVALRSDLTWPCDFTPVSLWCPPGMEGLGTGKHRNEDAASRDPQRSVCVPGLSRARALDAVDFSIVLCC